MKAMILDVLLHRRLYRQSEVRWLIHSLIFLPFVFRFSWGLVALLGSLWKPEWTQVWAMLDKNHPTTAFLFDLTGIMAILGVVLIFAGYILFQYRMVLRPPKLEVEMPKNGAVVVSPVKVEGVSEVGVNVIVEERMVKPDINGYFSAQLELEPGEERIVVEAISRFGKSSRREIELTVISGD